MYSQNVKLEINKPTNFKLYIYLIWNKCIGMSYKVEWLLTRIVRGVWVILKSGALKVTAFTAAKFCKKKYNFFCSCLYLIYHLKKSTFCKSLQTLDIEKVRGLWEWVKNNVILMFCDKLWVDLRCLQNLNLLKNFWKII